MIDAVDARFSSKLNRDKMINDTILGACLNAETHTYIRVTLTEEEQSNLKKLGYTVDHRDTNLFLVSWNEGEET
jgi:hypothetical protein